MSSKSPRSSFRLLACMSYVLSRHRSRGPSLWLTFPRLKQYHQLQDQDASMNVDTEGGKATEHGSAFSGATASLANKSIVLGYAFCLRNHLKTLYNITEQ